MLAGLLEANLARHPERAALLHPAVVEVEAADAEVAVAIRLAPGRVEVSSVPATGPEAHARADGRRRADVRVRADGHDLLALSGAPLRLGFPDPFHPDGRAVLGRIIARRVRVWGMIRHPAVLSRFARLLSVS